MNPSGALSDLRVVDFTRVLSGPMTTMSLGDLGADVVKVEHPLGDDTRSWGPPFVEGESTYFLGLNRNKRSVTLDLKEPDGQRAAFDLASQADVLIENFRPGTMDRLGLGYEECRAENPALIYCSISGFGTGAGAALPGYDFLVQAVGGLMSITGDADGEPTKVGVALVDVIAGLFAGMGVLAALRARDRSGIGQRVETNLLSCCLAALVNQGSSYVLTSDVPERLGNSHPSIAPYESFRAADREIVVAVGTNQQFAELCAVLGLSELVEDPRFASNAQRVKHRNELRSRLNEALSTRPASEWVEMLQGCGVPSGMVNDIREAFSFAENLGLQAVQTLPRDDGSAIPVVSNPLTLSETPITYRMPPPRLGEHSDEILDRLRV